MSNVWVSEPTPGGAGLMDDEAGQWDRARRDDEGGAIPRALRTLEPTWPLRFR